MIPIALDPRLVRVALAGRGALAVRRLSWFDKLGVRPLIFSDAPEPDFAEAAGADRLHRLPNGEDLARIDALWVADLPMDLAEPLAAQARAARVLVNVEDVLPLCDFHTPAIVRRGRLVLSASTGGASPAVASVVRQKLEHAFPDAWGAALETIAQAREGLRAAGADHAAMTADARARLAAMGLLPAE